VTLRARWVTLRARWVTLRARWVTLRARWVTLRVRWVTLRVRIAAARGGAGAGSDREAPPSPGALYTQPAGNSRQREFSGVWRAVTCDGLQSYLAAVGVQEGDGKRAIVHRMSLPIHELRMHGEVRTRPHTGA
jgi:hypothetical protein